MRRHPLNALRSLARTLLVPFALLAGPAVARATTIDIALVVDASTSVFPAEYSNMITAYTNALTNVLPADGSVGITVVMYGTNVNVVVPYTVVSTSTEKASIINAIGITSQAVGETSTGAALAAAIAQLGGATGSRVIDLVTDGDPNVGSAPITYALGQVTAARGAGIDVHVAAVGSLVGASYLGGLAGAGASVQPLADFDAYSAALEAHLAGIFAAGGGTGGGGGDTGGGGGQEPGGSGGEPGGGTGGQVPEPASVALALAGAAIARGRVRGRR